MMLKRWAIFISGRGSNLQAALEMRPWIDTKLVVTSSPSAYGILRAKRAGIPIYYLEKKINWDQLHQQLCIHRIQYIFLAGFMKMIPAHFVEKWTGRILNIHPSLLPAYPGLHSIERAYQDGAPIGATLHVVTPEMDAGPIVRQKKIENSSFNNCTLEEAEFKTHLVEHQLVREVLVKWF